MGDGQEACRTSVAVAWQRAASLYFVARVFGDIKSWADGEYREVRRIVNRCCSARRRLPFVHPECAT